jgi:hypothetical protein
MFTSVQNISHKAQISPKTVVFVSGMTLAKHKNMKLRITYKELTMIFGILIAAVMMFTLWVRRPQQTDSGSTNAVSAKISQITVQTVKNLVDVSAERLIIK